MPGGMKISFMFSKWELTSGRTWGTAGKSQRTQACATKDSAGVPKRAVGCAAPDQSRPLERKERRGKKKKKARGRRQSARAGGAPRTVVVWRALPADLASQSCRLGDGGKRPLLRWNAAGGICDRHHIPHGNPRSGSFESPKSVLCGPRLGPIAYCCAVECDTRVVVVVVVVVVVLVAANGAQSPPLLPLVAFTPLSATECCRLKVSGRTDACINKIWSKTAFVESQQLFIRVRPPH